MGSDQKKKVASGHSFYLREVQIVDICFCWSYTIHAAYGVEIEASVKSILGAPILGEIYSSNGMAGPPGHPDFLGL